MNLPVTCADLIRSTLREELSTDESLILMGLGVNDPKGVFGTTLDLYKEFGCTRVIETPTSENAMLGVAIGLAIQGHKVVSIHQRLDFFLLAMDQLVNGASKWNYMFGGETPIPITVRLILGRGWGQGPTHSQNLHALFTHLPGVKVVMPALAQDAGPLLSLSIKDPNPVIFLEDRWLHFQNVGQDATHSPVSMLGQHASLRNGIDATIIASGFMVIEALRVANSFEKLGLSLQVIDLKTLKPLDIDYLTNEISITKNVIILDSGPEFSNYGSDIAYRLSLALFNKLERSPLVISALDAHEPTSHGVIQKYKVTGISIAFRIANYFQIELSREVQEELNDSFPDVPNNQFRGPF
jgi:acetoin:2,6-dichlorophenolindophenol oxidoreductase subunit beta